MDQTYLCSWNVEGEILSITNADHNDVPSGAEATLYGVKVISAEGEITATTNCKIVGHDNNTF